MSDKLCHCVDRMVSTLMEEDEPLEYTEDVPQVASSTGAHSSHELSKYFKPRTGAEVKVTIAPEVEIGEVIKTDRNAKGSLVTLEVERELAECNCAPAVPVLAEDVIMCPECQGHSCSLANSHATLYSLGVPH